MTAILHVSLDFAHATDTGLDDFAIGVHDHMDGNPTYPTPPVTMAQLAAATTTLSDAVAASADGGPTSTAAKNNARDALIAKLRELANYVDNNHGNDMEKLLSSGFKAQNTNHAQSPLPKAEILRITNGNSGQLLVTVKKDPNARGTELRFALIGSGGTPGPWQAAPMSTKTRSIPLDGLTPGQSYAVQARGFGGSTGFGGWSDSVIHMSM